MASANSLLAMGLTARDASDEHIKYGNHLDRDTLMKAVKVTDPELAQFETLWKKSNDPSLVNHVHCEVPNWIAKISAVVPEGHSDGIQDKALNARYYLCKEETAIWAKKYLKFSIETSNNKTGLKSTAPAKDYDVSKYDEYIPKVVRDASDKYKTKFYTHYIGRNPKLTGEMITLSFISFICYHQFGDQRAIDEHVEEIHGFTDGVTELSQKQTIEVDSKIAFNLPSLLDVELLGPDKRKNKFNEVYVACVARNIIKQNANEANSDLNKSRSAEFMNELKKSTTNTYYERFKMHLKNLIGPSEDIDGSFSCKYYQILSAFKNAINKEQDSVRLENFLSKNFESFHSLPLEILIGNVDKWVDSVQGTSLAVSQDPDGRTISEYTFCILWKYSLIFNIAVNLPGDMRIIKEVVKNKITEMFEEKSTIMTIPKFQEFLVAEMEKKSLLTAFRNDNIPVPKKGLAISEASVGKGKGHGKNSKDDKEDKPDNPEDLEKFKQDYFKEKIDNSKDKDNVKLIKVKASEMAKDPKYADLTVMDHPEMKTFLKEKKIPRGCWCCFRANCFKRRIFSRKYKLKNTKFSDCKGAKLKFKDMEGNPTTSTPTVEGNTTTLSSDETEINNFCSNIEVDEEYSEDDINFQTNTVKIYEDSGFTKDKIPNAEDYELTPNVKDKDCPLCNKKNMSYSGIFRHLMHSHKITWGLGEDDDSTYEEWEAAFYAAKEYDYENIMTETDDSSDSSTECNKYGYTSTENHSDDPEFDNFSPVKKQKRRKNRSSQKDKDEVEEIVEKLESKYEETAAKVEKNSIKLENINRDIQTLSSTTKIFQNENKSEHNLKSEILEKKINLSKQETKDSIKNSLEIMSNKLSKSETNLRNETDASITRSMQTLSEKIHKSEENLKNELTSITNSSTKNLEGQLSKIFGYIEILEQKLESQGETLNTKNRPSGHVAPNTPFTSVQKTRDNPQPELTKSHPINHSSMKDTMESPPQEKILKENNVKTISYEDTIIEKNDTIEVSAGNDPKIMKVNNVVTKNEVNEEDIETDPKVIKNVETKNEVNKEDIEIEDLNEENKPKKGVHRTNSSARIMHGYNCQEQEIRLQELKNERARIKQRNNLYSGLPGIIWGTLFFLSLLTLKVAGNPAGELQAGNNAMASLISSQNTNAQITIYALSSLEANNYQYSLNEVRSEIISGLESACSAIPVLHQTCVDHPSSCQSTDLDIKNQENAIRKHAQSLFTMERLCETPNHPTSDEIIQRCSQGKRWSPRESPAKKFHLLSDMFETFTSEFLHEQRSGTSIHRPKRFVVSVPIVVATAIGVSSMATAGVTAAVIAHSETKKVIKQVNANRIEDIEYSLHNNNINLEVSRVIAKDLDSLRFTQALASDAINSYNHAVQLNTQISHLFSDSEVIKFSNPFTENWFQGIIDINKKNSIGLSTSEMKEKSRISGDVTTLVTTLIPLNNRSHQCSDMMILKTLIIPIIDHTSRIEVQKENGIIRRKYGNHSTHIVFSQNALISKETRMFGSKMSIVGRTCEVENTVNATTSPSNDPLMEHFSFSFEGNLTIEEECPINGTQKTFTWSFTSLAVIKLPITCSLKSALINCKAIKIIAGTSKKSHITHYRMKVVKTKFDEETVNKTEFIRPNIKKEPEIATGGPNLMSYAKWPIIGSGIAITVFMITTCIGMMIKKRANSEVSVKIENNSSPTVKIDNSSRTWEVPNPSAPVLVPSLAEQANPEQDRATLTIQDGIDAIRAVKPKNRTPFQDRDLKRYISALEHQLSGSNPDEQV